VALADWIGSDQSIFEFKPEPDEQYIDIARSKAPPAMRAIGLNIEVQKSNFSSPKSIPQLFDYGELRPLQQAVVDFPTSQNIIILEAETGAGKTEAALLRFFKLYSENLVDGLYFAVPTRAAAIQCKWAP